VQNPKGGINCGSGREGPQTTPPRHKKERKKEKRRPRKSAVKGAWRKCPVSLVIARRERKRRFVIAHKKREKEWKNFSWFPFKEKKSIVGGKAIAF